MLFWMVQPGGVKGTQLPTTYYLGACNARHAGKLRQGCIYARSFTSTEPCHHIDRVYIHETRENWQSQVDTMLTPWGYSSPTSREGFAWI